MYRGVKRALDFITALLALIVLSPLLAITALVGFQRPGHL